MDCSNWEEHRNKKIFFKGDRKYCFALPPSDLSQIWVAQGGERHSPCREKSEVSTQLHSEPQHKTHMSPCSLNLCANSYNLACMHASAQAQFPGPKLQAGTCDLRPTVCYRTRPALGDPVSRPSRGHWNHISLHYQSPGLPLLQATFTDPSFQPASASGRYQRP